MENYYFINSVDPENQMMRIQEVGAGEMSAQQVRITKEDADVYSLMLDEATQEGGAADRSAGSKIKSKSAVEKIFSTSTNKNRFSFFRKSAFNNEANLVEVVAQ